MTVYSLNTVLLRSSQMYTVATDVQNMTHVQLYNKDYTTHKLYLHCLWFIQQTCDPHYIQNHE